MKKILSLLLAAVILLSSITVSLMFITSADSSENLILNPGFEDGLDNWVVSDFNSGLPVNAEATTTEKNTGEKSLHRWLTALTYNQTVYQSINLEANTEYNLSLYIKGKPNWGRFIVGKNKEKPFDRTGAPLDIQLSKTYTDWTKLEYSFTPETAGEYVFSFVYQAGGVDVYFDDISITKKNASPVPTPTPTPTPSEPEDPNAIIKNAGFENGLDNWSKVKAAAYLSDTPANVTNAQANKGEYSLYYNNPDGKSMPNRAFVQTITLEANTKYAFSFYSKGSLGYGRVRITTNKTDPWNSSDLDIFSVQLSDNNSQWTEYTYFITTDDRTEYDLVLAFTGADTNVYFDSFSIAKPDSRNLVNPGFEDDFKGWVKYNGPGTTFDASIVTTEKHGGEKSLHRVVGGTASKYNQIVYTPLVLNPKSSYTISFWMKGDPAYGRFYVSTNLSEPHNHDSTLINHQWAGDKFTDWTKVSYTFTTKDITDVNLCFYFSAAATDIYLDDFSLIENDITNLVANGDFSNGDAGWEKDENFAITADKYVHSSVANHKNLTQSLIFAGGNLKTDFDGWLNQKVTVNKGTKYDVSLDAYLPVTETEGCDVEVVVAKTLEEIIAGNGTAIALSEFTYGENYWQTLSAEYTPDDSFFEAEKTTAQIYFALRSKTKNAKLCIDNIKFGTLAYNSDFEATAQGKVYWYVNNEALKLENIVRGQNYKLTFKYKGVNFADNVAMWTLSTKNDFDPTNTYVRGYVTEDAVDWKEASFVFNTGSQKNLNLIFQTLSNDYCIDDVKITPTTEAVNLEPLDRAFFVEAVSGSYYAKYKQPANGANLIANEDFVGTSTGGYNDALGYIATSNGGESAAKVIGNGSETGASYLGNSSLKFSAGLEEESILIPLSLKANTNYYVGLYIKAGPYVADEEGWSRFSYGIADTSSGNFIRVEDITAERQMNLKYADAIQNIPRFDEEWHYVAFKFNTKDQTDLSFMLRGRRMTAYVDKLYVWEDAAGKTTDFLATLDKVGPVKNIKAETKLLDIGSGGKNLIENFNFESGTDFWKQDYRRVGVYGNNLNITNSEHSVQKNSFLYENQLIYPWNCYYIQWIDVEPDTDYTFSAKYAITETGEGFFGILPGYRNDASVNEHSENMLFPSNGLNTWLAESPEDMYIAYWDFGETNYDENQNWQTVGVTFNSGDRNRIGFFVQDGGGTAYIDDLKLFETKYAVEETAVDDNFAESFRVKKGNVTAAGSFIKGFTAGMKFSEVLDYFEDSDHIRFYDSEGEEITDLSSTVKSNIEVRLMNGPVVKDRAVLVIPGDVNGDGALDSTDSKAIIEHVTLQNSLEGVYLEAADFDGDGKVSVYDALFNKSFAENGTASFTLDGPQNIVVGKDMKVTLTADTADVFALSGKLVFKSGALELKSIETDLENWDISFTDSSDEVIFAAVNSGKKNGSVKDKVVLSFTFTVGNIKTLEDVQIVLQDGLAATSDKLLTLDKNSWPKLETEEETTEEEASKDSETDVETKPEKETSLNNIIRDDYNDDYSDDEDSSETTVVKAANRLAVLKIDEAEISPEFDPEIREYTATVPFEVEKVTVTAIAENEDATVTVGDTNLEYIGKNAVRIDVVSADGLTRAYRIIVTREAPATLGNKSDDMLPLWAIILIIAGAALVVAAIVLLLIIIMKKRKKTA